MSVRKCVVAAALTLSVVCAMAVVGCNSNPAGSGTAGDGALLDPTVFDSVTLAKMNDSLRVVDSAKNIAMRDSMARADSLENARLLDSLRFVDSLAYLRMVDSLAAVRWAQREQMVRDSLEQIRIVDSIATANSLDSAQREEILRAGRAAAEAARVDAEVAAIPLQARNVIGYGYDITATYADPTVVGGAPILDIRKLVERNHVARQTTTDYRGRTVEGSSIESFQSSMSRNVEANIGASLGFGPVRAKFAAQVRNSFTEERTQSAEYAFLTSTARTVIDGYRINARSGWENLLDTNFVRFVQNNNGAAIVRTYGTHVILGAMFGGRIDYNMSMARTSMTSSISLSNSLRVSAGGGWLGNRVSANYTQSDSSTVNNSFNTSTVTVETAAIGGDPELASKAKADGPDSDAWHSWVGSVSSGDMGLCDFYDGSLLLISELITDTRKKQEVENAIRDHMGRHALVTNYRLETVRLTFNTEDQRFEADDRVRGDHNMGSSPGRIVNWNMNITGVNVINNGTQVQIDYVFRIEETGHSENTIFQIERTMTRAIAGRNGGTIIGVEPRFRSGGEGGTITLGNPAVGWHNVNVDNAPLIHLGQIRTNNNTRPQDVGHNFVFVVEFAQTVPVSGGMGRSLSRR